MGVDADGGTPDGDFTDEGGGRVAARRCPYRLFTATAGAVSDLICKALGIEKGSPTQKREKVGTLSRAQVKQIAETKMKDLNANDIDAAMRMVEGTARSMGVEVA